MFRNEVQKKIGLTRKAITYYEEKGLIHPTKLENGYRDYSEKDVAILSQISIFRKLGISISDMKQYLSNNESLTSLLREKEHQLDREEKRKEILVLMLHGESQNRINEKINRLEAEESIYVRLKRAFPGYFGDLLFASYQPFFDEPLDEEGKEAFQQFIEYLDNLPSFVLSQEEKFYIEQISSCFDRKALKAIHQTKQEAIENVETWLQTNKECVSQYESYKNSEEYQKSPMKSIQDQLQEYMEQNKYYEIAIPLIRKFSRSYDSYYKKLLKANEQYIHCTQDIYLKK